MKQTKVSGERVESRAQSLTQTYEVFTYRKAGEGFRQKKAAATSTKALPGTMVATL